MRVCVGLGKIRNTVQASVTKHGAHDKREAPWSWTDFGLAIRMSEVNVTNVSVCVVYSILALINH